MIFSNTSCSGLRNFAVFLLVLMITACANERPVYHGAEYYKNLEVPPDLTEPDVAEELKVPKPTEEALQRFRDNNKLDTVITPKFDGVRMVSYAGNSWIEIDNNADIVWPRLIEFWEREGIELVQVRPILGFMETDWTTQMGGETGFFGSIFQKLEPDVKDKFRVRIERFDSDQKTRLYIAHARIERRMYGEYGEDFIWVTQASSLETEREMISRMAFFAGLSKEQSAALLENYRPYSSLVKIDSTNTIALTMKGSMDFVWRRTMRALDRMQMQDINQQKEKSTITFSASKISSKELNISDEDDDLAKSSWLMNMFTDSDETDVAENTSRQYRLEFTDLQSSIQIEVKDARDSQSKDDDGDTYSTALAEQLRDILVEHLE